MNTPDTPPQFGVFVESRAENLSAAKIRSLYGLRNRRPLTPVTRPCLNLNEFPQGVRLIFDSGKAPRVSKRQAFE